MGDKKTFGLAILTVYLVWMFFATLIGTFLTENSFYGLIYEKYHLIGLDRVLTIILLVLMAASAWSIIRRYRLGMYIIYLFCLLAIFMSIFSFVLINKDNDFGFEAHSAVYEEKMLSNESVNILIYKFTVTAELVVSLAIMGLIIFYAYRRRKHFTGKEPYYEIKILKYIKLFFTNYKEFCEKYLANPKPPLLIFFI